jgi:hypothetical protein
VKKASFSTVSSGRAFKIVDGKVEYDAGQVIIEESKSFDISQNIDLESKPSILSHQDRFPGPKDSMLSLGEFLEEGHKEARIEPEHSE